LANITLIFTTIITFEKIVIFVFFLTKASRRKDKLREKNEMRDEFLFAAELYLNCERYPEAAKCLSNAKEVKPAISLYTKLRQVK
jgi:hypothetical protein